MRTLHVVIPVYNEGATLEDCLQRVLAVDLPAGSQMQLHLIDDCSNDSAYEAETEVVERLQNGGAPITFQRHPVNQGKGAALQTGFDAILSSGVPDDDIVVVQDADLEYDPNDFVPLMQPILSDSADATIGTRWGKHNPLRGMKRKLHGAMNRFLSIFSNTMTGLHVRDMECCYKMMTASTLRDVRPMLTEPRFGIEPQFAAAFGRLKVRLTEVAISYDPRGVDAGKKINWKDGVRALYVIMRERFRRYSNTDVRSRGAAA